MCRGKWPRQIPPKHLQKEDQFQFCAVLCFCMSLSYWGEQMSLSYRLLINLISCLEVLGEGYYRNAGLSWRLSIISDLSWIKKEGVAIGYILSISLLKWIVPVSSLYPQNQPESLVYSKCSVFQNE